MSIRQGDNIIAGKVQVDETPTLGSTRPVSSDGVYRTCANRDADNFTDTGTTFLSRQGMPDFEHYDSLTILASGNTYTAPANGWFYAKGQTNSANTPAVIYLHGPLIEGRQTSIGSWAPDGATGRVACCIYPVTKGTTVEFVYGNSTINLMLVFIYAEGDKTNS